VALIALGYVLLPVAAAVGAVPWWSTALGLVSIPLALRAAQPVLDRTDGPSLNRALAATGAVLAAFSILVTVGLIIAA
jgi:1,4-dihydroxy-2-naphthoate octaprenyltransferase